MQTKQETYVYIDGEFFPKDDAKISIYDHGLLYGDGVYEALREYDGVIFKLREHVDRLYESAKSLKIDIPLTKDEMKDTILKTVKKNGFKSAYIRVVVTRGKGRMGVDPRNCPRPTIIVTAEPREPIFGAEAKGVSAIISSLRRTPIWALDPRIKSLNYLNNVLARIEAIEAGAEEAILLNERGYVAESSTENIFVVKDSRVITPPVTAGILRGITRDVVIRIAKELGHEVEERNMTTHELFTADEVFVTGTAAEIVPITLISGRKIGTGETGPTAKKLIGRFRQMTHDPSEGTLVD